MASAGPRIGAVAIGRNEGERLRRCLASLEPSGMPVVYVDSASTDGSAELAHSRGAVVVPLALDRPFTAARARAAGYAALRKAHPQLEFVFFVDGDCEVDAGWPDAAMAFLDAEPTFAAVCGRRRERDPAASPYNAVMDREWATPPGEAEACGGDAVYRTAAYDAVGGFDPLMLAGEEPELCARMRSEGWRIMRLDTPMTLHDAAMTHISQWWRRAVRSGYGYAQAWTRTRKSAGGALYTRQAIRAIAWAGMLPLGSCVGAVAVHPALLLAWPALTGLNFLRIARRAGTFDAKLAVLGKYAEAWGMLRFLIGQRTTASYR